MRKQAPQPSSGDQPGEGFSVPGAVSPEMALRLSRLFHNSPEFWLNAQRAVDLWNAARHLDKQLQRIRPLDAA